MFRIIKPRLQHHFLLRQKYPLKTAYSHLKPLQHYHTSIHRFLHSSPSNTKTIKIVEVSPRDGLQNIPTFLPTSDKITLIQKLQQAGCCNIEATAFVSPKWVPQMSDAKEVLSAASKSANHRTTFSCLVPNARGLHEAVRNGAKEVAVFGSASETFSRKNINCGIEDSFGRFREVCSAVKEHGVPVRGYVSCVMGCPYEGHISKEEVARVSGRLVDMGCDEISLGDSIGVGTAGEVVELLDEVKVRKETFWFFLLCKCIYPTRNPFFLAFFPESCRHQNDCSALS